MQTSKEKLKFWSEHIAAQKQSSQTVKAYCDSQNLKRHQFTYYKKRSAGQAPVEAKPRFLPVAVALPQGLKVKVDGVELEFSHDTPANWIAKVIWEVGRLHAIT